MMNTILENYLSSLSENNMITFPKEEWSDVKKELSNRKEISTTRNSCGKNKIVFKSGDKYKTQWNVNIEITKIQLIKDPKKIPTWKAMNKTMRDSILYGIKMCGVDNLQWIHLRRI